MIHETDGTPMFDAAEFAKRIGFGLKWVRHNAKQLPHHKVGNRLRFCDECVAEYKRRTYTPPWDPNRIEPRSARSQARLAASERRRNRKW